MSAKEERISRYDKEREELRGYWAKKLATVKGPSNLPLDYDRPKVYANEKNYLNLKMSTRLTELLARLTGNSSF